MTRVLIVAARADHATALVELLGDDDRLEIAGWFVPGSGAPEDSLEPDVLLLTGVARPPVEFAGIPSVLLTTSAALPPPRGSVRAHLPENATAAQVAAALIAATQEFVILTPAQADSLAANPAPALLPQNLVEPLTARELQVLRAVAFGSANKEIAAELGISEHTVKFHVASILGKLQVSSRTEAVTQGIRSGLIPI